MRNVRYFYISDLYLEYYDIDHIHFLTKILYKCHPIRKTAIKIPIHDTRYLAKFRTQPTGFYQL